MRDKIANLFYSLDDAMPTVAAVLLTVVLVLFAFGLGFLFWLGMAWITMLVYNTLANAAGLPIFSVWFWLGVWVVIGWLKKGIINVRVRKEE